MEDYIRTTVKLTVTAFTLYKLWETLIRQRLYGLWDRVFPKKFVKTPPAGANTIEKKKSESVVGKTHVTILEDPETSSFVPVHSEKLQETGFIGEDEEISPDEVEVDIQSALTEEERFDLLEESRSPGMDLDFFTGLTYEDMINAVGVLTASTTDDEKVIQAAQTIFSIRQTDLFDFFSSQISNSEAIENLFKECLDDNGSPLPSRRVKTPQKDVENFDWNKYV